MSKKRVNIWIEEELIEKFDKKIEKVPRDKLPKKNRSRGIEKIMEKSIDELEAFLK